MSAAAQEADRLSQLRTQQPDDFAGEVLEDVLDDVMDEVGAPWGRGGAAGGGLGSAHLRSPVSGSGSWPLHIAWAHQVLIQRSSSEAGTPAGCTWQHLDMLAAASIYCAGGRPKPIGSRPGCLFASQRALDNRPHDSNCSR